MTNKKEYIRNFCIIAHIDHGKSTLADRLLEHTNSLEKRKSRQQFLDNLDIERERGITIKAQTVTIEYISADGKKYMLNLIDTPGHADFSYEVSHSIKACEGALLVVDACQGVQAQTTANVYKAIDNDLDIIPVINKIDLEQAEPEKVIEEIQNFIGIDTENSVMVSAKTGIGIEQLLETIVKHINPPDNKDEEALKALIFDSWFDDYLGIVVLFRVFCGQLKNGDKIRIMSSKKEYIVASLGKHTPFKTPIDSISSGEAGYLTASIKNLADVRVGDTITLSNRPASEPMSGYEQSKPMVFSGLYPIDANEYEPLKTAIAKLSLNDNSITYEIESSAALGFGFRCGFLGLLHLEIVKERLEKEFGLSIILTSPSVSYEVVTIKDELLIIDNPAKLPLPQNIKEIKEPIITGTILAPDEYIGSLIKLCIEKRGVQRSLDYIGANRICLKFDLPLSEIVMDFYDQLKTLTKGYASFDYDFKEHKADKLVKLEILINTQSIDSLSSIVHRDIAYQKGRALTQKLKLLIPKQMYEVSIQAAIGSKVIARETISAMRKDVTAKCYGGDISRKRKLLEKQKEGKKRMKQFGSVSVPKEAFLDILKQN